MMMVEALACWGGHQAFPNLLRMFRPLSTTPSSLRVSSDWPGHCPCPQGFQLVPLLCQSRQEARSLLLLPPYKWLLFLTWPLSVASTQIELGILNIRLPPSPAKLSTPCPDSLGQVAGICLSSSGQRPQSPSPAIPSTPPG